MNKVQLIGRLVKDPEIKSTSKEKSLCYFRLAVDRHFASEESKQKVDFISCLAWDKTADFLGKYFKKGSRIGIAGRIESREWEKDGQRHSAQAVLVEELFFADGKVQIERGNEQHEVDTPFSKENDPCSEEPQILETPADSMAQFFTPIGSEK